MRTLILALSTPHTNIYQNFQVCDVIPHPDRLNMHTKLGLQTDIHRHIGFFVSIYAKCMLMIIIQSTTFMTPTSKANMIVGGNASFLYFVLHFRIFVWWNCFQKNHCQCLPQNNFWTPNHVLFVACIVVALRLNGVVALIQRKSGSTIVIAVA